MVFHGVSKGKKIMREARHIRDEIIELSEEIINLQKRIRSLRKELSPDIDDFVFIFTGSKYLNKNEEDD